MAKKITYIIALIALALSMFTCNLTYSHAEMTQIKAPPMYANDIRNFIHKDPSLSVADVVSKMRESSVYDGCQYANISLNVDIKMNKKNVLGKVALVTQDILDKNIWQITQENGENLAFNSAKTASGYEPVLVGGLAVTSVKLHQIIAITIKSGEKVLDMKCEVIGKLYSPGTIRNVIPEYAMQSEEDIAQFTSATIVMKDAAKYAEFFTNREDRLVIYNKDRASAKEKAAFSDILTECGAIDNSANQSHYYQSNEAGMAIVGSIIVALATLLLCISIYHVAERKIFKLVLPLASLLAAFAVNIVCTLFVAEIPLVIILQQNLVCWLLPLIATLLYTVAVALVTFVSRSEKSRKGVSYDKI